MRNQDGGIEYVMIEKVTTTKVRIIIYMTKAHYVAIMELKIRQWIANISIYAVPPVCFPVFSLLLNICFGSILKMNVLKQLLSINFHHP